MQNSMKDTGIASVDAFVSKVNELLKDFRKILQPLEERNHKMMRLTGFKHVHHATIKHALVGMFLSFGQAVSGDLTKLKIEIKDKSPYIKAKIAGVSTKDLEEAYEEFEKYAEEVEEILMEKLPKMVETATELAEAAGNLKDNAKDEFEALGGFEKVRAIAKCVGIASDSAKIPGVIRKSIEKFKHEIMEIKDAVMILKEFDKLAENAKKCSSSKKHEPYECYVHVYGHIESPKKK